MSKPRKDSLPHGNIRVLTEEQVKSLEDKYKVSLQGDMIVYEVNNAKYHINRAKRLGEKHSVSATQDKFRVTILPLVQMVWKSHTELSIFRLQNEYNRLAVMHQPITEESLLEETNAKKED